MIVQVKVSLCANPSGTKLQAHTLILSKVLRGRKLPNLQPVLRARDNPRPLAEPEA